MKKIIAVLAVAVITAAVLVNKYGITAKKNNT